MRGEACLLNQLELLIEDAELVVEAPGGLSGPHEAAVEPALEAGLLRAAPLVEACMASARHVTQGAEQEGRRLVRVATLTERPKVEHRLGAESHVRVVLRGLGPDLAAVDLQVLDEQLGPQNW